MALKRLKAWWWRRQLRRRGIAADPGFHPIAAGKRAGWDGWRIMAETLNRDSILYSFGIGNDASFDLALIERFGLQVHGFDPTPESMAWVKQQNLPPQFVFHPLGLAAHDGTIRLYPPRRPGKVNFSQERLEYVSEAHQPIEAAVARLPAHWPTASP